MSEVVLKVGGSGGVDSVWVREEGFEGFGEGETG